MTTFSHPPALMLIVEDDALTRISGVGIFLDAGFRMIEAGSGDEALAFLETNSDVRLLFTDVDMPGTIDGLTLARQVHDRWPHIGIIIASGQSASQADQLPVGARCHRKPYSPAAVVMHARELTAA